MNILVVGQGGREHAMLRALSQSSSTEQLYVTPGRAAMSSLAKILKVPTLESQHIIPLCKEYKIDLVVVGPEDPLVAGLSDGLRAAGILVFGPDKQGALLEGSKKFSKEFMNRYSIPTAPFEAVKSTADVASAMKHFTPPYVLKADGLAAGKGVFICKTTEDLLSASRALFEENFLGEAGQTAILEQFQPGYELSFFVLTNGEDFVALPLAQDHKKLKENEEGPNTGGMGTVAPLQVSSDLYQTILKNVVEPTVHGLAAEKFLYRGVVFIGLMITENGPQVLEYNVRFGDPETQVLLPLLDGDWAQVFTTIAKGEIPSLQWQNKHCACVVVASENYPGAPVNGVVIQGLEGDAFGSSYVLHAGTDFKDGKWITQGGRVLNSVGEGNTLEQALEMAYSPLKRIQWPGMQFRTDIGQKSKTIS